MAMSRLAALRAQRQGQEPSAPPPPQQNGTYELNELAPSSQGNDVADGFLGEISAIQDLINEFNGHISKIADLHARSLTTMGAGAEQIISSLDDQVTQARDLSNQVKKRIETLRKEPISNDRVSRRNQVQVVVKQFMAALQTYNEIETDYRQKQRQRVERQLKIVKPDATAEEVTAFVENKHSGDQIFASALTQSRQYSESRAAYREVQDRHEDIRKIERTLEDVAQLMSDMSVLIVQQDETVEAVETQAGAIERDARKGAEHMDKAVISGRSARRKRFILFGLVVLLLAIIGAIVAAVVATRKH